MKNNKLDQYEKKILNQLAIDGRVPITVLADRIGISKTPCQKRLNRLISDGYITGFKAVINPKMMAMNHTAFIQVKLKSTTKDALLKFNKAVNTVPEIVQCHLIASSFDYPNR